MDVPIGKLSSSSALQRHSGRWRVGAIRFALQVVLLGVVCHASTEFGFAHKLPPHGISALWPTIAILFSVLVAAPVRHWWAYILAAYFTSVINDMRAGFPVSAVLFITAGILEVLIAAVLVRRFADGVRAFQSLRCALIYILSAVVAAPALAAFVAALAGGEQNYFFYWRVWFLSEALAYLMLAPAILAWFAAIKGPREAITLERICEALLVFGVLALVCALVFWLPKTTGNLPALVYLPLPLMLWATVRFGPLGLNSALVLVALVSISGAVHGHGPFGVGSTTESVLALQLFLATMSVPLMLLAAVIAEAHTKGSALRTSEANLQEQRRELAHLSRVAIVGELSGALAHELNQPLTAILSNAQAAQRLMTREPLELQEIREILTDIVDEDKRAGEIIHRIRALLKKGESQFQTLNLAEVAQEVIDLVHADVVQRGVAVSSEMSAGLPMIRGDRVQLQQVILNLIANACDAMADLAPHDRKLTVSVQPEGDTAVRVSVADRGSGIPAETMDRLFQPFFTTKEQGLGLGLAICRSIVAAHGGRLGAENNAVRGATFHLSLSTAAAHRP